MKFFVGTNDFLCKTLGVNDHALRLLGANLVHDNSDPLLIPNPGLSQIQLFFVSCIMLSREALKTQPAQIVSHQHSKQTKRGVALGTTQHSQSIKRHNVLIHSNHKGL